MSTATSPIHREPELLGQTVVVIGGSVGIGFETARRARAECGTLLRLVSQKNEECSEVDRITMRHLADIEAKVSDLSRLAAELQRISGCCRGDCGLSHYLRRIHPDSERGQHEIGAGGGT
jgi:NAD(P)-dependent dehydrogenase (short-subunit alcohol dehydrogenase family)